MDIAAGYKQLLEGIAAKLFGGGTSILQERLNRQNQAYQEAQPENYQTNMPAQTINRPTTDTELDPALLRRYQFLNQKRQEGQTR